MKTFLFSISDIKFKTILCLMFSSGLRVGEVRHLKCPDIEHSRKRIHIRASKNHYSCRNRKLLYGLLHTCCAETLLELSSDKKYLGAAPGIIQVLHTWNQELDYHVHMHCIISGGGLTKDHKIRRSAGKFFIPIYVLRDKFKGKYLSLLNTLYEDKKLVFLPPAEDCGILMHRRNGKTAFMGRLGVLT